MGIVSRENFRLKEGGAVSSWRNLGVLAVQCVREAVGGFGGMRVAKSSRTKKNPPPPTPRMTPFNMFCVLIGPSPAPCTRSAWKWPGRWTPIPWGGAGGGSTEFGSVTCLLTR